MSLKRQANDQHGRSYPMLGSHTSLGKPNRLYTGGMPTRTTASKAAASYTDMLLKEQTTLETNPLKMFDQSATSSYGAVSGRESGNDVKAQLFSSNLLRPGRDGRQQAASRQAHTKTTPIKLNAHLSRQRRPSTTAHNTRGGRYQNSASRIGTAQGHRESQKSNAYGGAFACKAFGA